MNPEIQYWLIEARRQQILNEVEHNRQVRRSIAAQRQYIRKPARAVTDLVKSVLTLL